MTQRKRRPEDINRAFNDEVEQCRCGKCGPSMRFELETAVLVQEFDHEPNDAELAVCWRYGLPVIETSRYFAAAEGLRLKQ